MPAERGIFLDVLPRFDMAALAAILSKVEDMFKRSGSAIGSTFGKEAEAATLRAAEAKVRALNAASDAELRAEKATHAHEIANQRLVEVQKKAEEGSARLMRARYAEVDAQKAATLASQDYARAQDLANKATDVHAAKVEAMARTSSNAMKAFNIAGVAALGGFAFAMGESVKSASEFQTSMTKLTAAAGESTSNIMQVQQGILKLAGQVSVTCSFICAVKSVRSHH